MNRVESILCIGAHPDDIELACGGTLLKFKHEYSSSIHLIVCTKGELKNDSNLREQEQVKAAEMLQVDSCKVLDFKDGSICADSSNLIKIIEDEVNRYQPNVIFTHSDIDHHQDHVAVSLASVAALRYSHSTIMFYPSVNHNQKKVNTVIDISNYFEKKIELLNCFETQKNNWYFDQNFLHSMNSVPGKKYGFEYAEEFYLYSNVIK